MYGLISFFHLLDHFSLSMKEHCTVLICMQGTQSLFAEKFKLLGNKMSEVGKGGVCK